MIKNKIVVITGGCGLLGMEFAKTVIINNGIPILADYSEMACNNAKKQLSREFPGKNFDTHSLNIIDIDSIRNLISYILSKYGKIDALVNCAYPRNKNYGRKFEDVTYTDFCENVNLNLGGYFLTSQQFLIYFSKQGYGNIINISSIYGVIPPRFDIYDHTEMTMPVEYAAIKSALIHLTKYMAKYYKGQKIKINSISLGGIIDKQPTSFLESYKSYCLNKGMLDKSSINGTLVYLLSDQSLNMNGQNVIVDDGFTL